VREEGKEGRREVQAFRYDGVGLGYLSSGGEGGREGGREAGRAFWLGRW